MLRTGNGNRVAGKTVVAGPDDGTYEVSTPEMTANLKLAARGAVTVIQQGGNITAEQGLAVAAFAASAALGPEAGAAVVAFYYGTKFTIDALVKAGVIKLAAAGGGQACPTNDCKWCGDFDLAHDTPPENRDDPRWVIPSKLLDRYSGAEGYERFALHMIDQVNELWHNCKVPSVDQRSIIVETAKLWNATKTTPSVDYVGGSEAGAGWGYEPSTAAWYIRWVLSPDWDAETQTHPHNRTVTVNTAEIPQYIGKGLKSALGGFGSGRTSLGIESNLRMTPTSAAALGLSTVTDTKSEAKSAVRYYVKKFTGKDWNG